MSAPMPRVAIDGPAGAGKSTIARRLAEELGYLLVDTGALYRVVSLAATRAGIAWHDEPAVGALAERLVAERAIYFERREQPGDFERREQPGDFERREQPGDFERREQPGDSSRQAPPGDAERRGEGTAAAVMLRDEDVSLAIRAPENSLGASRVSAIPAVRAALLDMQRQAGAGGGVVLEGRDIGTVVFPDAEVKFFLTASPAIRARRRFDELSERGASVTYEDTLADVSRRDKADTERPVAPLRQADDARLVDSSGRDVDDLIAEMSAVVREAERRMRERSSSR
ncbi:MAG: d(CMP) kinase [Polyangiaceae bacterium]